MSKNLTTALIIVADGFEELEAVAPIDLLRRAGIEVTVASSEAELSVTGRNGIRLECDCLLDQAPESPSLLIIPGGPSFQKMRKDERVLERIRQQRADSGWIGAICAAPVVLAAAGVLDGIRHACHPSVATELPDNVDEAVVCDEKIITSRGAGTAIEFGLALVEALRGRSARDEIADAICHDSKT